MSAATAALPAVGARLATVTLDQCRTAAATALAAEDPGTAREAARIALTN